MIKSDVDEEDEGMIKNGKINWKWILFGALIGCVLFLILAKAERAEAASYDFVSRDYSSYKSTIEDLYACYVKMYGQNVINERPYYLVIRSELENTLHFVPTKEPVSVYYRSNGTKNYITFMVNDNVSFLTSEGKQWYGYLAGFSVECNDMSGVIYCNYVPDILEMSDSDWVFFNEYYNLRTVHFSSAISYFHGDLFYDHVNIEVNGITYTVSESLRYYLALKETDGSIRLFFSDIPFTGDYVDLYNRGFQVGEDAQGILKDR